MSTSTIVIGVLAALCVAMLCTTFAWTSKWLAARYAKSLEQLSGERLADLLLFVDGKILALIAAVLALCAPLVVWLISQSATAALLAAGIAFALPHGVWFGLRRYRHSRLGKQLPESIAALAAALRGGLSLPQAVALVAAHQPRPIATEFALLIRKQRLGVPIARALDDFASRVPQRESLMLAAIIRLSDRLGGGMAAPLERLAAAARRHDALREKLHALTSQARLQGWVLAALPIALMALFFLTDDRVARLALHTHAGWAILGIVTVMECIGLWFMHRIVAAAAGGM